MLNPDQIWVIRWIKGNQNRVLRFRRRQYVSAIETIFRWGESPDVDLSKDSCRCMIEELLDDIFEQQQQ